MHDPGECFFLNDALAKLPQPDGRRFISLLKYGSLDIEMYAPRGFDPQQPHSRDEVYVVAKGTGEFVCGRERWNVGPGDLLFVPAGLIHRFENFCDDLAVWVIFHGPEGGERSCNPRTAFKMPPGGEEA